MTHQEFSELLVEIIEDMRSTLGGKNIGYASENDALHNFKRAARMGETTPEKALWGMLLKHLVSVRDGIDAPDSKDYDWWSEKLGDIRNYLVLLQALRYEQTPEYKATYMTASDK